MDAREQQGGMDPFGGGIFEAFGFGGFGGGGGGGMRRLRHLMWLFL